MKIRGLRYLADPLFFYGKMEAGKGPPVFRYLRRNFAMPWSNQCHNLSCVLLFVAVWALISIGVSLFPPTLFAKPPAAPKRCPLNPADTSSPAATLESFLRSINTAHSLLMQAYDQQTGESGLFSSGTVKQLHQSAERHFRRAKQCLDLSDIPSSYRKDVGYEAVILLKEILDRLPPASFQSVPGPKAAAEKLMHWIVPHTEIQIQRVPEGPRKGAYLFSRETVRRLPQFYRTIADLPYQNEGTKGFYEFYHRSPGRLLPPKWNRWLPQWSTRAYHGQTLWQWMFLTISVLLLFVIPYLVYRLTRQKSRKTSQRRRAWLRLLLPASIVGLALGLNYFLNEEVNLTGTVLIVKIACLEILLWLAAAWSVILIGNGVAESIVASPRIDPRGVDASLVRTVSRLASIAVAVVVLLDGISRIGVSLVPILTGLGVAGLALSLAARPTIENIIGGIMLFADKPVRVGDFCQFGDTTGSVMHIGLRSTRIRGLDRTYISVPNADFSQYNLVNLSRRDRTLLRTTIGLRYETTPDQLRYVLSRLREMLMAHPKIYKEPLRVRFVGFGTYSLNIEIYTNCKTKDYGEHLAIQEDIFLRTMGIVKEAGTGFAIPAQTNYLASDAGTDEERTREAEARVQAWRSSGNLPFPDTPKDRQQAIKDSLDFPPKGSPDAAFSDKTSRKD